ncbi:hypothetical protein BDZ94DRAFT_1322355 [Collybia nuda]|uniref:Uncharacterized protein n=1 Tax=Collybia nuda TaxID=64659 RepID=A0A9P5Y5P9_9AGAR|nr:hypothetical protein BDZ94DRAFT_1322355 [Collybia nuda]
MLAFPSHRSIHPFHAAICSFCAFRAHWAYTDSPRLSIGERDGKDELDSPSELGCASYQLTYRSSDLAGPIAIVALWPRQIPFPFFEGPSAPLPPVPFTSGGKESWRELSDLASGDPGDRDQVV